MLHTEVPSGARASKASRHLCLETDSPATFRKIDSCHEHKQSFSFSIADITAESLSSEILVRSVGLHWNPIKSRVCGFVSPRQRNLPHTGLDVGGEFASPVQPSIVIFVV